MFNIMKIYGDLMSQHCVFCGADGQRDVAACEACLADLPWHDTPHCPQCGLHTQGEVCGACLNKPPNFDRTIAVFNYAYPIDAVLEQYKYQRALHLSHFLGALLSQTLSRKLQPNAWPDAIIAMPLHRIRLKARGFNQSLEIAKIVASELGLPLLTQHSARIKHTTPQAQLKLKDRAKNIQGAFTCQDLTGLHIALVDDVITSGASFNELAKMVKQAGATEVTCWVLARTQSGL